MEGFIRDQCPLALKDKGSQPGKSSRLTTSRTVVSSDSVGLKHLNQTDEDVCKNSRSCPTSWRVVKTAGKGDGSIAEHGHTLLQKLLLVCNVSDLWCAFGSLWLQESLHLRRMCSYTCLDSMYFLHLCALKAKKNNTEEDTCNASSNTDSKLGVFIPMVQRNRSTKQRQRRYITDEPSLPPSSPPPWSSTPLHTHIHFAAQSLFTLEHYALDCKWGKQQQPSMCLCHVFVSVFLINHNYNTAQRCGGIQQGECIALRKINWGPNTSSCLHVAWYFTWLFCMWFFGIIFVCYVKHFVTSFDKSEIMMSWKGSSSVSSIWN